MLSMKAKRSYSSLSVVKLTYKYKRKLNWLQTMAKEFNKPEEIVVQEQPVVIEEPKKEEPTKEQIVKELPVVEKKRIERPYLGQTEEELASLLTKWRDIYRNSIRQIDKDNAHEAIREIEKEQKRRK